MQVLISAFSIIVLLFVGIIASTLVGGVVGWIVGAVFPFVPATLNAISGLQLTAFEVGAVLGFVGSFFRSSASK